MNSSCCSKEIEETPSIISSLILYKPLIVIVSVAFFVSIALAYQGTLPFMNAIMGVFLALLASLKLFNLSGFSLSFAKYDLVARKFPIYGFLYPFIELLLSGLYLAELWPIFTNVLMITVMVVGTVGVINVLISGKSVQCACVGASFKLPVGKVTFFENITMMLMAAFNLFILLVP